MRRGIRMVMWHGLLATITIGASTAAYALDKVKTVIPQNSINVLVFMGGKDTGIFKRHGIDLAIDVRPFGGYVASLPSKECMVTSYSGLGAVASMNQGVDWVIIGGGLMVIHEVYVLKDSPIKTIEDLRGKRFGVWSASSGVFKALRTAIIDASGLDVARVTTTVELAPPALFKLFQRGDVDAMVNVSPFAMRAASQPEKYRSIFSATDYWKEKTGSPLAWAAPLVAWRGWVEEDRERAKNFSEATTESYRWLGKPENLETAIKKYGTLAGLATATPGLIATYKKWLGAHRIFLTEWNQKVVDSQWRFLELAKRLGIIQKVPPKDKHAVTFEN